MEVYKIENLTFKYPQSQTYALNDISLSINKGEFITICGKSGCGKSTLLRQLKPCISPHGDKNGNIYFENQNLFSLSLKEQSQKIGFVFQNPDNQIVCDKVWHELAFGLENLGLNQAEIRQRVAETAAFFGIQSWFHKPVCNLSGGQKQILNLASVMVMQPTVLILDEPTSQLDPIAASDFFAVLLKINREFATTVILSEHCLEDAFSISDKIVVMDNGKILASSAPNAIGAPLKAANHDMIYALPTAMRCAMEFEENLNSLPITVRDGQKWLLNFSKTHTVDESKIIRENKTLSTQKIIDIKNLKFRYEKNDDDIIKNLSCQILKGEIYAILGGNGAGKTTLLSLIGGQNLPYSGKILIDGENIENFKTPLEYGVCLLSQNPASLFIKKTLLLDFCETLNQFKMSKEEKERKLSDVINLCELDGLLDMHPYDLSGGEAQRAAIAKILLLNPKIILLDEPTKGIDAYFKIKLADILCSLKKAGTTIVMVSHDIEFCANYADRCAMLFDGEIIGESAPDEFFKDKNFYTTTAARIAKNIIPKALLAKDIVSACGKTLKPPVFDIKPDFKVKDISYKKAQKKPPVTFKSIISGSLCILMCILANVLFYKKLTGVLNTVFTLVSILFLGFGINLMIPQHALDFSESAVKIPAGKSKPKNIFLILAAILLIGGTVLSGVYFLNNKKYYFISLLIILETIMFFFFSFEKRKPNAREIITLSVLCAIGVAGRAAFFMLPQFKPILAVIIISGICFGAEAGFLVGAVSGFVSNFFFAQGPWTPWQMFAFGVCGFLSGFLFQTGFLRKTKGSICIFGFICAIIFYGGILNLASVMQITQKPTFDLIAATYALGLPFDIIHAASTAFFLYFIAAPMIEKIDRIKIKYGLLEK